MNRLLLAELQALRCYPSITVLFNTTPGAVLRAAESDTAARLIDQADRRLVDDVDDSTRTELVVRLRELLYEQEQQPAAHAVALCVSPEYTAPVKLGRSVEERVIVDDTFATRDLVADLNRTALYRVATLSERRVRILIGDRQRLVESREEWPLERMEDESGPSWKARVAERLAAEHARVTLPTILAGVQRSVQGLAPKALFDVVGTITGNQDRTSWVELHHAAWPMMTDWLRNDQQRALERLDTARSANRYAGGINEIWPLARDGRVEMLVVEETFSMAARIDENHQLLPADDPEHPEVNDDIIDDTIETVLRLGGSSVMVGPGVLDDHQHIAAVLRY
jgi:hypothetical protein